jgi:protein-tyrosine phosphatase
LLALATLVWSLGPSVVAKHAARVRDHVVVRKRLDRRRQFGANPGSEVVMPLMFEIHEVAEGLWVGPCPDSPEKVLALRQRGINGLVSVQTDGDLGELGMSWALMWKFLMASGISCTRVPIQDFDDGALAKGLSQAVQAVHGLRGGGRITYLHCTAGINRSPTVAIGYLHRHTGLALDIAWDHVVERRPSAPNRRALDQWLGKA